MADMLDRLLREPTPAGLPTLGWVSGRGNALIRCFETFELPGFDIERPSGVAFGVRCQLELGIARVRAHAFIGDASRRSSATAGRSSP